MSTGKSMRLASIVFPCLAAVLVFISCDENVGRCFGVNLENTTCASENILSIGQQDGLACYNCVGDVTGDLFDISWSSVGVQGSAVPGTLFVFLNTTDRYLAEFTDCSTITLYDISQGPGGVVKGGLAGTLEEIDPFQVDRLSLFFNIPGVRNKTAVCDFCKSSSPAVCF
jgi:hypothetical protein